MEGPAAAFAASGLAGVLGGLVGLAGAEFRLRLLLVFGFMALQAVVLNNERTLIGGLVIALVGHQPSRCRAGRLSALRPCRAQLTNRTGTHNLDHRLM